MIVVMGEVRFAQGEIARLQALFEATIQATRGEPGCELYSYAIDLLDPDLLRISERWTDRAALDAHFTMPHMATLQQGLGAARVESMRVTAYPAEPGRTLLG